MPQGSVLDPVLFNALPLPIIGADVDIYADDKTVHAGSKDCKTVENKLQHGASGFKCWSMSNKMYINIPETIYMIIGSRQNINRNEAIEI